VESSPLGDINLGEEDQIVDPIVTAIRSSDFDFRTPDGIASALTDLNPDMDIDPNIISKTLRDNPLFIRASSLNREGKPLYAVRSDYLANVGPINAALSALTGRVG
jgi:hypothetical protein